MYLLLLMVIPATFSYTPTVCQVKPPLRVSAVVPYFTELRG